MNFFIWRKNDVSFSTYLDFYVFVKSSDFKVSVLKFVGHVPSWVSWVWCHRAIVPSWVFHGLKIFSRGYFVGSKYFLVGISWVPNFFSRVFRGSKVLSRGHFVQPKFFSRRYFVEPKFSLVINFVIFSCWLHEKKWHRNISQTSCSIPNRFLQLWILLILWRYFIY